MAPYTAEDMWANLGHNPPVARAGWPEVIDDLVRQETVTCVVQIKGKVRARLEVPADVTQAELERLALADDTIARLVGEAPPRRVIVRAPKLVNVIPG